MKVEPAQLPTVGAAAPPAAQGLCGDPRRAAMPKASDGPVALVAAPDGNRYPATTKLYFEQQQLGTCEATVLGTITVEEKGVARQAVLLDQTVMHPQGGGQ